MRRLFWLAMGVTIGALLVRKVSQMIDRMTPGTVGRGIADGLSDLADSLRDFSLDVREAMHEREAELRVATGLDPAEPGSEAGAPR